MKTLAILFLFLFFQSLVSGSEKILSIKDALAKNVIKCNFTGNSNSPHYYQPLILSITNNDNEPIKVKIDNGQKFIASDESFQNLVLTKHELIALSPGETKKLELFSMCIESHDHAPLDRINYTLGEMASGSLLKLTLLIETKGWFDYVGQMAVWCLIDNNELDYIYGPENTEVYELVKLLAKETGKAIPPPPAENDYKRNFNSKNIISTVKGTFKYTIAKTRNVSIILMDNNGLVVRELYRNPKEKAGDHSYEFTFDSTVYKDDVYLVKLVADGKVLTEKKIVIR